MKITYHRCKREQFPTQCQSGSRLFLDHDPGNHYEKGDLSQRKGQLYILTRDVAKLALTVFFRLMRKFEKFEWKALDDYDKVFCDAD